MPTTTSLILILSFFSTSSRASLIDVTVLSIFETIPLETPLEIDFPVPRISILLNLFLLPIIIETFVVELHGICF